MSTDRPDTAAHDAPVLTDAAQRSSGSFELVLGPVLMALIGLVLDRWLGTGPWLVVLFTLWGAAGAIVSLYFRYRRQVAEVSR